MTTRAFLFVGLLAGLLGTGAHAQVIQINPDRDNTLYEPSTATELSSALGPQLFAGRTGGIGGGNHIRRGLLRFDVAGSVPFAATIGSVELTVECSMVSVLDVGVARTIRLQRATADWGEGTSDAGISGGSGAVATTGDASWNFAFFPGTAWATAGGDISPTVSSTISVPSEGTYTFPSTPQLVADVQDMLANPAGNFGWVILGEEGAPGGARAFDTREAPAYPFYGGTAPELEIQLVGAVPALPWPGLLLLGGLLLVAGTRLLRTRRPVDNAG